MLHYITYAAGDKKYYDARKLSIDNVVKQAGNVTVWDFDEKYFKESIPGIKFYEENKKVFLHKRGAGMWIWKPYLILKVMNATEDGDIILYADSMDGIKDGFVDFVKNELEDKDYMLIQGHHLNQHHTGFACFESMDCCGDEYYSGKQLEAGIVAFRNNLETRKFVEKWLEWCKNPVAILGRKGEGERNFPGFSFHKGDQPVLSLLQIKNSLPVISINKILPHVEYNKYDG